MSSGGMSTQGQSQGQAMGQAPSSRYGGFGSNLQGMVRGINENAMSLFRPRSQAPVQQAEPPSPMAAYPEQYNRTLAEQAYTQAFRPGPTGQPFNPNPTPAPTTGPQGQALITRNGQQGYFRQATADEIRRATVHNSGMVGYAHTSPVAGYDPKTKQVFTPYSPQSKQTTQQQQFFQPIYLSRYQNYQPEGFQGPFGGQINPYGGFNPFMGFGGMGDMYAFAKGGKTVSKEANQESGIAGLLK